MLDARRLSSSTRTRSSKVFGPRCNPASAAGRLQGPGTDNCVVGSILFRTRMVLPRFGMMREEKKAEKIPGICQGGFDRP